MNEQHGYNGRLQPTSINSELVSPEQTIRNLSFGYAAGQQEDGTENNGSLGVLPVAPVFAVAALGAGVFRFLRFVAH